MTELRPDCVYGAGRQRVLRRLAVVLGCAVLLMLGSAGLARAAEITVDDPGDGSTGCTLREAVTAANTDSAFAGCAAGSGADTITFAPGLAGSTITLTGGELILTSTLTIAGGEVIAVSGNNASRVFNITSSGVVTLTGLTIRNGNVPLGAGGGLLNTGGSVMLSASTVLSNSASTGGGIYNESAGSVTLSASSVLSNSASTDGGGIYNAGSGSVINMTTSSLVQGNLVDVGAGGGIYNTGGSVEVLASRVVSNSAPSGGGIFNGAAGSVTLFASSVLSNRAGIGFGGGVYNTGDGSVFSAIAGSQVEGNLAVFGGGIYNDGSGDLIFSASGVASNVATFGGGIVNATAGNMLLSASSVVSNSASSTGGGIYNQSAGHVTLSASSVVSNSSDNSGGGIYNLSAGSFVTITDNSLVQENRTANFGGGVYNADGGSVLLAASSVVSNTASAGGGIYNVNAASFVTITNISLVQANSAASGAGIYNADAGSVALSDSIVASNDGAIGGGIFNSGAGSVTVAASSVVSNSGGGLYNSGSGSAISMTNSSLVARNSAGIFGGGVSNNDDGSVTVAASHIVSNSAIFGGGLSNTNGGSITIADGSVVQENSASNGGGGLYNTGVASVISITASSIVSNSASNGGGLYQNSGASQVTTSCIVNNSATAIAYIGGTAPITATGNWWGHPSGPSGAGPGLGDSVSANVDFSGFLGAPILGCASLGDPDLAIAKTVTPAAAVPGETITYTLSFSNTGQNFSRIITISDSVPVSVTISDVTSSTFGSGVFITQTGAAPDFAWTVSDLTAGAGGYITLTGVISADVGLIGSQIINTATISGAGDTTAGNNSSTAVVTVARLDVYPAQPGIVPGGSVTISATVTPPRAGLVVNFTVTSGSGGLSSASAATDAGGTAAVVYNATASTEVAHIEGTLADTPLLSDRATVFVAVATAANGIEKSTSGDYAIGNLSPNHIQITKQGDGTPLMGWGEFAGNPCPASAPGTNVVSPYVDAMVEDVTGVDAIVVTLKYTGTAQVAQYKPSWCNDGVWQPVTATLTVDGLVGTLVFTLTGATSPTLLQLDGTPFVAVGPNAPTAVNVGWFTAAALPDRVELTWQTVNEVGLYGFNLYRSTDAAGPGERITVNALPAYGTGALEGYAYVYADVPVSDGVRYYWLEELHLDRAPTLHGPQQVIGGSLRIFLPTISR